MKSVAIIGAGITGLTAAYTLQKRQVPVTVYEASDRVGGVIRSERSGGYLAEYGPNTILETSPRIGALLEELGLKNRRLDSDPRAEARFVVRGRQPVALPMSAASFFTCKLFSTAAKLRLLREPFIGRAPADQEESVADFVRRRLGQEFLDYAINPLVSGIYAGDPAKLSIQHAFAKIYALEKQYGSLIKGQFLGARERKRRGEVAKDRAKKLSFDEGLQVLPDTLYQRVRASVRLNSPVTCLSELDAGWRVTFTRAGREETADHAAVLWLAPAYHLPQLRFETRAALSLTAFGEIYYPPVASVVLGFRREDVAHPCCGFGMLNPHCEGFHSLGTIFSSALFPNRAPAGHLTLTTYVGGAQNPETAALGQGELVELTLRDLRELLGVRGQPTFIHTCHWPRAIPQYVVGYGRYKQHMTDLETKAPGLFFAGHYRDGVALSDSILAGQRVAERIAQLLNLPAPTASKAQA